MAPHESQDTPIESPEENAPDRHEETFTPVGSMFLMVMYILIFATAWGLVYFGDLLARR